MMTTKTAKNPNPTTADNFPQAGLATLEQAGKFLSVSQPTLKGMREDGTFTDIPVGNRGIRLSWSQLRAYAKQ